MNFKKYKVKVAVTKDWLIFKWIFQPNLLKLSLRFQATDALKCKILFVEKKEDYPFKIAIIR